MFLLIELFNHLIEGLHVDAKVIKEQKLQKNSINHFVDL